MDASSLPSTYVDGFHDKQYVEKMPYLPLGKTGINVSKLSFGASSLGSVFRPTDDKESIKVLETALKRGINYVDTAPWYGHGKSEKVLGQALKGIPRESYYIATKVGRYLPEVDKMFDFRAERTIQSVDESLARLGLDYVDVIQVHDMEFAPNLDLIINETLPALQKVKDSGKARFIGITGYPLENFRTVLQRSTVKIDTVLTYCRGCIHDDSLSQYIPFFQEKQIGVINASPIAMGLLSNRGAPDWHPARDTIKEACRKAADYTKEKNMDISRLAMGYTLGFPGVDTTLFSTASVENLGKNLDSIYTPLTTDETSTIEEIIAKFMKPLQIRHWEGVEVEHYWNQIKGKENTDTFVLG